MDIFFTLPLLVLLGLAAGAVFMVVRSGGAEGSGLTMERAIAEVMGTATATPKTKDKTEAKGDDGAPAADKKAGKAG